MDLLFDGFADPHITHRPMVVKHKHHFRGIMEDFSFSNCLIERCQISGCRIARTWFVANASKCEGPTAPLGIWTLDWASQPDQGIKAEIFLVAALIRHNISTGQPQKVVYSKYFETLELKLDVRAFRDSSGKIMLLHSTHHFPEPGTEEPYSAMKVSQITIKESSENNFDILLSKAALLPYSGHGPVEKNWVPWNGTTMMSYPHHGSFAPHSVFDWDNYIHPLHQTRFYSEAPSPFFEAFSRIYDRHVVFAGGTPAILDEGSWLAVGHSKIGSKRCHRIVQANRTGPRPKWRSARFDLEGYQTQGYRTYDYFVYFYR